MMDATPSYFIIAETAKDGVKLRLTDKFPFLGIKSSIHPILASPSQLTYIKFVDFTSEVELFDFMDIPSNMQLLKKALLDISPTIKMTIEDGE